MLPPATAPEGSPGAGLEDPDLVHDLRVGSRRVGEAVRLLDAFMDKPAARAVSANLQDLRRAMGDLRDADVTRAHLAAWRMPAPLRALAREAIVDLDARRAGLVKAAATVIASASVQGTMVVLARVIEEQSRPAAAGAAERRLAALVARGLRRRDRQLRRAFGKAARRQTPESLHAARVSVKKLRYVSELALEAKPNEPGDLRRQVKTLKKIQELLGAHHDVHVLVHALEDRLKSPRPRRIRGLASAWRRWHKAAEQAQARRAADFFMRTYAWMNTR
jgi:CHAD domain-containing protein